MNISGLRALQTIGLPVVYIVQCPSVFLFDSRDSSGSKVNFHF